MNPKQTKKREAIQKIITDEIRMAVVKELVDGGMCISFMRHQLYLDPPPNVYIVAQIFLRVVDERPEIPSKQHYAIASFPEAYAKFLELTK